MKKIKKIISFAAAMVLSASCLSGCGTGEKSKNIVIGGTGPLTGSSAQYGLAVKNAAELAVEHINEEGGVNGTYLELHFEDDEGDSGDRAVNAYNVLKDEGMQIFLGTVTTGSSLALIEKTNLDNIFQITPSASAVDVIRNDNCFQICFTDPNQGTASADFISQHELAAKVAVIYDSSDAYSSGIYNTFITQAEAIGLDVVSETSFTKDSKTDFSAQLSAAKTAGADLVFLPIYYQEASLILRQAKTAGYSPKFFGCDGLDGILATENFDITLAENVMLLTPFAADAEDAATQKFVTSYREKYGETPNQFAADAYDGVYILAKLIEENNITADMSNKEICDILINGITSESFSYDGLTGESMTWSKSGEVSKAPKAVVIKNGAYQSVDE